MSKAQRKFFAKYAAIVVILVIPRFTFAANPASDSAADSAYLGLGNFNGLNGGTNFGPWQLSPTSFTGTNGWYSGSSTTNNGGNSAGIDTIATNGQHLAWGGYANGGATSTAVRAFTNGPLDVGQTFRIDVDSGYVESNQSVVVALQNPAGQNLVFVSIIGYSVPYIHVSDDSGERSLSNSVYTPAGIYLEITEGSNDTYTGRLTPYDGSYAPITFGGTLIQEPLGEGIGQVMLFLNNPAAANHGPNWDAFFNNMQIFTQAPFQVTAINTVNATNATVSFASVPGALHSLQSCTNLVNPTWSTISTNVVGTGGAMQLNGSFSAGPPQRFYRIDATY
jgi:hypothetical protein